MGQKLYKLGVVDEYQIEYKNSSFHERELCRFILPRQLEQKTLCKRNYVFCIGTNWIEETQVKSLSCNSFQWWDNICYKNVFSFSHCISYAIYDIHFLKAIFVLVKYGIICYGWFYNHFFYISISSYTMLFYMLALLAKKPHNSSDAVF